MNRLAAFPSILDPLARFFGEGLTWRAVHRAWKEGQRRGRESVVGCLVLSPDGRIFAQRRSPTRKTFPGCWDLVGGHAEPGERPRDTLVRELAEETGWTLDRVLALSRVVDWESPGPEGTPIRKRELVLLVTVRGDWERPRLETTKVTEGRWFGRDNLEALNENRQGTDSYVYDLVRDALESL